jgi:hypothetical protein
MSCEPLPSILSLFAILGSAGMEASMTITAEDFAAFLMMQRGRR